VRLFWKLLFLIPVLMVWTGNTTCAEDNLPIEVFPKVVKQGDACLIKGMKPASLKSMDGEFLGRRFPIALRSDETYEGLVGVDMNTRAGVHLIKVKAPDGSREAYSGSLSVKVEKVDFGIEKLSLPSSMVELDARTLERVNKESERLKTLFQGFREESLWKGAFARPVEGEVSATFGVGRIINGQRRSPHTGIDLQAEEGTPVLACNNGIVVLVDQLFFSGKSVILDHGWGLYSMYFHLSEVEVREGERVRTGSVLGRVGSTGRSTRPHLHWGILINGARVDPVSLLRLNERLKQ